MKQVFLILFCFALAGTTMAQSKKSNAQSNQEKGKGQGQGKSKEQGKPNAAQMAKKQAENLQKLLTLSEEQKAQVETAALNRITQMDKLKASNKGQKASGKAMKDGMRKIRQEYVDAVQAVLTPAQAEQWKKHREEKKQKSGKGKSKGKGQGGKNTSNEADTDPNEDVDQI